MNTRRTIIITTGISLLLTIDSFSMYTTTKNAARRSVAIRRAKTSSQPKRHTTKFSPYKALGVTAKDPNPYTILQLDENAALTKQEIRAAYLKRMKEFHPDKYHADLTENQATEVTQLINNAYDAINPLKQQVKYTRQQSAWQEWYQNQGGYYQKTPEEEYDEWRQQDFRSLQFSPYFDTIIDALSTREQIIRKEIECWKIITKIAAVALETQKNITSAEKNVGFMVVSDQYTTLGVLMYFLDQAKEYAKVGGTLQNTIENHIDQIDKFINDALGELMDERLQIPRVQINEKFLETPEEFKKHLRKRTTDEVVRKYCKEHNMLNDLETLMTDLKSQENVTTNRE